MNKKKVFIIIGVLLLIVLSQWLLIKLVYANKLADGPSKIIASIYRLKAGVIEEENEDIVLYLDSFLENKDFANKLLANDPSGSFSDLEVSQEEVADLVWAKLLKFAWLEKVATENDINIEQEDIDYYIQAFGGQEKLDQTLESHKLSMKEYRYFLIEPDILEAKVYNYLVSNFQDERGVLKMQEAYALLEAENGENWNEVVSQYADDISVAENSIWLSEEELVDIYEPIKEMEVGQFSKIVQLPIGYIIWHLDSISEKEGQKMWELRGLFIYAQTIDDFFNDYLENVNIKKIY